MKKCCICNANIEREDPEILSMGRYANPRYLCDGCAESFERITTGVEYEQILSEMEKIGERMTGSDVDDPTVIQTVGELMAEAKVRAEAIHAGTYDFSLDEVEEPTFEITEDLLETEEDRELDRKEEEAQKRLDSFLNWAWVGAGIAFVGFVIWRFFLS